MNDKTPSEDILDLVHEVLARHPGLVEGVVRKFAKRRTTSLPEQDRLAAGVMHELCKGVRLLQLTRDGDSRIPIDG